MRELIDGYMAGYMEKGARGTTDFWKNLRETFTPNFATTPERAELGRPVSTAGMSPQRKREHLRSQKAMAGAAKPGIGETIGEAARATPLTIPPRAAQEAVGAGVDLWPAFARKMGYSTPVRASMEEGLRKRLMAGGVPEKVGPTANVPGNMANLYRNLKK